MHMTMYTFTSPLAHSEVVALATRHWPMPCAISIVKPDPFPQKRLRPYHDQAGRRYTKPFKWFKFNRARKATAK